MFNIICVNSNYVVVFTDDTYVKNIELYDMKIQQIFCISEKQIYIISGIRGSKLHVLDIDEKELRHVCDFDQTPYIIGTLMNEKIVVVEPVKLLQKMYVFDTKSLTTYIIQTHMNVGYLPVCVNGTGHIILSLYNANLGLMCYHLLIKKMESICTNGIHIHIKLG